MHENATNTDRPNSQEKEKAQGQVHLDSYSFLKTTQSTNYLLEM